MNCRICNVRGISIELKFFRYLLQFRILIFFITVLKRGKRENWSHFPCVTCDGIACPIQIVSPVCVGLRKILYFNGYPSHIADSVIRKVKRNVTNDRDNIHPQNRCKYITAPCIRGTSERAARILKKFPIKLSHLDLVRP